MVTPKYERAVSVDASNCRGTVIELLFGVVIIDRARNPSKAFSWTCTSARNGPCESPA
jgi:hypothetical protein